MSREQLADEHLPGDAGVPGLVSCILPVYNRPRMVVDAIRCVADQTYAVRELIVVDDGSTDETPERAREELRRTGLPGRVVTQPNSGPGAARNLGFRHSRGEFIQYLDSDDLLLPDKFREQVACLEAHSDTGVCYCKTLRRSPDGSEQVWASTGEEIPNIFPSFLPKRGWATLTPLWRRTVCNAVGAWLETRVLEDWEHDLRAGLLGTRVCRVDATLAVVRDHAEERASGVNSGWTLGRVRDRQRAMLSVWKNMKSAARLDPTYLRAFSRELFHVARQCGTFGLRAEAVAALKAAIETARTHRAPWDMRVYRALTVVGGWRLTGAVTERVRETATFWRKGAAS